MTDLTIPGSTCVGVCVADGAAPVTLLVHAPDGARAVSLVEGQRLLIGRDTGVEIQVVHEKLSRRHACLELHHGEVWVEDLGSTNGTQLNGAPVKRHRVVRGDVVSMGPVVISVHRPVARVAADESPVVGYDEMRALLRREVVRARAFKRSATLVALRASPAQIDALCGAQYPMLAAALRPVDQVTRYSDDTLQVLLPEIDASGAEPLAQAIARRVGTGQLRLGVATFPSHAASAEELVHVCLQALGRTTGEAPIRLAATARKAVSAPVEAVIVRSAAMIELHETLARLAGSTLPVLLLGETGTGKEVLARAVHELDERRKGKLVCINCGAIPETLIESALFGHEAGAFTGASGAGVGIFEEADGGTVLLDEVGELSAAAQTALLRVLETKHVRRIGSRRELTVDVRVIAATNRDLEVMCQQGRFRTDLLYRLNVMVLQIPPLRERLEEIAPLAETFLAQAASTTRTAVTEGLSPEALRLLHGYSWPGNVRELRNVIERAAVIARGPRIEVSDLPQMVRQQGEQAGAASAIADSPVRSVTDGDAGDEGDGLPTRLLRFERKLVREALDATGWNRQEAAQRLQIPLRTLANKIAKLGIQRSRD